MWFPRPEKIEDIHIIGKVVPLTREELFALLHDTQARELKEKVGVVSRGGSAKSTTRLLESQDWFFKSDTTHQTDDFDALHKQLETTKQIAKRTGIWHPHKTWFIMKAQGKWWPMTGCPTLHMLRQITDEDALLQGWTQMINFAIQCSRTHQYGIDINPSNFGYDVAREEMYYVDEELYPPLTITEVGEAAVARIPENHQHVSEAFWGRWGKQLQLHLRTTLMDLEDWRHLIDGIRDYPLTSRWTSVRKTFIKGIQEGHWLLDPSVRRKTAQKQRAERICIFSDIHGNLPALKAVLKEATKQNVDSYIFLGDLVGYGPYPQECIDQVRALPKIKCLRGNHDQMIATGDIPDGCNRLARESARWSHQRISDENKLWLLSNPLEIQGDSWIAVHGAPQDPERIYAYVYEMTYKDNLKYLYQNKYKLCLYGHTHVPFIYRMLGHNTFDKLPLGSIHLFEEDSTLLINPGSVGQPRDRDPRASFAIWDQNQQELTFHRVEYEVEETMEAIHQSGLPEDLAIRLEMGW